MPTIDWSHLFRDSRGNKLHEAQILRSADGRRSYVCLQGAPEVCRQVRTFLEPHGVFDADPASVNPGVKWDTAYGWPGQVPNGLEDFLILLKDVLTLSPIDECDLVIALDFYKQPDDAGNLQNTKAGALVNKLKYWLSNTEARVDAGRQLAVWIANVVRAHPELRDVDLVIAVPSTQSGVSEVLGRAVSAHLGKPLIVAREITGSAEQDKAGDVAREKLYNVPDDLKGKSVLVLDDVYWKGRALRGVATAARRSRAHRVVGLVAARNLRT